MRCCAVVVIAACASPVTRPALSNHIAEPKTLFAITEERFGPLDSSSLAALAPLRVLFSGYRVQPYNDPNLEFDIYDRGEKLLFVVPASDGKVFNVHTTSPRIASERGWRVGTRFRGTSQLTTCECWGHNPTCWHAGEHVAVNFNSDCGEISEHRVPRTLEGEKIQRVIWSPRPFPRLEVAANN